MLKRNRFFEKQHAVMSKTGRMSTSDQWQIAQDTKNQSVYNDPRPQAETIRSGSVDLGL